VALDGKSDSKASCVDDQEQGTTCAGGEVGSDSRDLRQQLVVGTCASDGDDGPLNGTHCAQYNISICSRRLRHHGYIGSSGLDGEMNAVDFGGTIR
jgi:hypothetical protein